jgi:hypothetical protein
MFLDRLNNMVDSLIERHHTNVEQRVDLLQTAAMLILAEEIHNLSTTGVGIQQAETDLATAVTNLGTVITNAVAKIQSGDPTQVQQASDTMETVAAELNSMGTQLSAAGSGGTVSVPPTGPAATGTVPTS